MQGQYFFIQCIYQPNNLEIFNSILDVWQHDCNDYCQKLIVNLWSILFQNISFKIKFKGVDGGGFSISHFYSPRVVIKSSLILFDSFIKKKGHNNKM